MEGSDDREVSHAAVRARAVAVTGFLLHEHPRTSADRVCLCTHPSFGGFAYALLPTVLGNEESAPGVRGAFDLDHASLTVVDCSAEWNAVVRANCTRHLAGLVAAVCADPTCGYATDTEWDLRVFPRCGGRLLTKCPASKSAIPAPAPSTCPACGRSYRGCPPAVGVSPSPSCARSSLASLRRIAVLPVASRPWRCPAWTLVCPRRRYGKDVDACVEGSRRAPNLSPKWGFRPGPRKAVSNRPQWRAPKRSPWRGSPTPFEEPTVQPPVQNTSGRLWHLALTITRLRDPVQRAGSGRAPCLSSPSHLTSYVMCVRWRSRMRWRCRPAGVGWHTRWSAWETCGLGRDSP